MDYSKKEITKLLPEYFVVLKKHLQKQMESTKEKNELDHKVYKQMFSNLKTDYKKVDDFIKNTILKNFADFELFIFDCLHFDLSLF